MQTKALCQQGYDRDKEDEKTTPEKKTLIRHLGIRRFFRGTRVRKGIKISVIIFPDEKKKLITLFTPSPPDQNRTCQGRAEIEIHRKFLIKDGNYLHWIQFRFQERSIKALILFHHSPTTSLKMIKSGASTCRIEGGRLRRKQTITS